MNFFELLSFRYVNSKGLVKLFWRVIQKIVIFLFRDPSTYCIINVKRLKMPMSHAAPDYLVTFKHYDKLPTRISQFLDECGQDLVCIDVGANVGDSISSFDHSGNTDYRFLGVEPNPKFFSYLESNYANDHRVTLVNEICAEENKVINASFTEIKGTANINENLNGSQFVQRNLDTIIDDNKEFSQQDVIKIDTDGFDFDVIKGCKKVLSKHQPIVLFELYTIHNSEYAAQCEEVMQISNQANYSQVLVYDNYGNFMGKYGIDNYQVINQLLFYQITGNRFYCFDFLLLPDKYLADFYESELNYFAENSNNETMKINSKHLIKKLL